MNDEKSAEQPDSSELPGGEKEQTGNKASAPKTNNNEVRKQELQDSFKRVHGRSDKFNHEWDLKREAKKLDMKDEEYRNWYELSSKPLTWRSRFWGWTGFGEKKLWDILQLTASIAVPVVLGVATYSLQKTSNDREQAVNDREQAAAVDKANQDTLVKYLDQMAELLGPFKFEVQQYLTDRRIPRAASGNQAIFLGGHLLEPLLLLLAQV